jgi:MscS family membrane protein
LKLIPSNTTFAAGLCLAITLLTAGPGIAQDAGKDKGSIRDLIESEEKTEKLLEVMESKRPGGYSIGTTPLSTLIGLEKSLNEQNFSQAASYLDLRYQPKELEAWTPEQLVRALIVVWNQQNIVDPGAISDKPEGNLSDGLPSYRDRLGTVMLNGEVTPIYLQRVPDGQGRQLWKLSNVSVAKIPEMWDEWGYSSFTLALEELLPNVTFLSMSNWQLLFTALFFLLAWPLSIFISNMLMYVALLIPNGFPNGIKKFFRGHMRFFIFIILARVLIDQLKLSLTARIILDSTGVDYIATIVLIMGLLSLARDQQIRKLQRTGNPQFAALLKPITTIVKMFALTAIALFWAESAGYNMSTILAGLGVGSLAVALAAQKTLENVFGAVTLYLARPVKAGDFCRFGDVVGTVEEIGLRSTILRTLDRTRVIIPNSVFSASGVENLSDRDRIRYFRRLRVKLGGPDQVRFLLAGLRKLLYSHPEVQQDTVSVRFDTIEDATALFRIDAGIMTASYQQYLAVAEDLNLRTLDLVAEAGLVLTGPQQAIVVSEQEGIEPEQIASVEQTLAEWRDQEKLPFPNYSEKQISDWKSSLDYPPAGSSSDKS